jgi:hypothetical protein
VARLEDLATGTRLTGLAASGSATVESTQWIGEQALKVIFRDGEGQLSERLLYRDDEPGHGTIERRKTFEQTPSPEAENLFPRKEGSFP